MTKEDAITILEEHNKWCRWEGEYSVVGATCLVTPKQIGVAIDLAIEVLREKIKERAMTVADADIVLEEYNRWRRGKGEYGLFGTINPVPPRKICETIDLAIKVLKEKGGSND